MNVVGVNSGSQGLFGVLHLFKFIVGSVMLVFSDFQGYEKTCYVIVYDPVYILFHLST